MTLPALLIEPSPKIARAWLDTLRLIARQPGITPREIATARKVDRKAALLTIRTLERRGLVSSCLESTSTRPKLRRVCTLTAKGQKALEAA